MRTIDTMTNGNFGSDPEFDEDIIDEYRRSAAQGFDRPPAAQLPADFTAGRAQRGAAPSSNNVASDTASTPRVPVGVTRSAAFEEALRRVSSGRFGHTQPASAEETEVSVSAPGGPVQPQRVAGRTHIPPAADPRSFEVQDVESGGGNPQMAHPRGFNSRDEAEVPQDPREAPFRWPGLEESSRDTLALDPDELTEIVSRPQRPTEDAEDTVLVAEETGRGWALDVLGGAIFVLPGSNVIVGRKPQKVKGYESLQIDDPGRTLSKSHARIFFDSGAWYIEDLASTNGTAVFVIGKDGEASEVTLKPGERKKLVDRFRLGTLHVRLRELVTQ